MMLLLLVHLVFAIAGGLLAGKIGRAAPLWAMLCFLLGPVGLLIVVVLEPTMLAERKTRWVRPWLAIAATAGCAALGAVLAVVVGAMLAGVDPAQAGLDAAESTRNASVAPAVGIFAGMLAAGWNALAAAAAFIAGGVLGIAVGPFLALALEWGLGRRGS